MIKLDSIKKVTKNKTSRYYTFEMNSGLKYRTVKLTKEEFEQELTTTKDEWELFLETDNLNYHIITIKK